MKRVTLFASIVLVFSLFCGISAFAKPIAMPFKINTVMRSAYTGSFLTAKEAKAYLPKNYVETAFDKKVIALTMTMIRIDKNTKIYKGTNLVQITALKTGDVIFVDLIDKDTKAIEDGTVTSLTAKEIHLAVPKTNK